MKLKKPFLITITLITRVILIIETIFVSTIKSKLKTTFKKSMCYSYNKVNHYRKNCTIQNEIEINKKILKKARLYCLDIDDE